jgi:hypothetical protein
MDRYMNSPKDISTDEIQNVADLEYGMEQIN